MAEINVTPFVDVMLVLLIVFMVTAPLLTVGVTVDLPQDHGGAAAGPGRAAQRLGRPRRRRSSSRTAPISVEELGPRLRAITERKPETRASSCAATR